MFQPNSKTPDLTKDTQAFVDALTAKGGPPLYTLTYEQARQVLIDAQANPKWLPEVDIKDTEFPVGPTGKVPVRILKPKGTTERLPIIFYVHGAGWVMGGTETHDRMVRELAVGANAAVVFPVYSLSPDAQYPVPIEQQYAALCHIAEKGAEFGLDTSRIAVSGDSVGGLMATVMAILAKQRKGPKLLFQALFYPVADYSFDTQSYNDFADGPWLTREAMKWFWNAYCPDKSKASEPTVSPLRASKDLLAGLPPALVITDENDVLRDEGEAYARKLIEAGVQAANLRCNGTLHDFMMLEGLAESAPTRAAFALANAALRHVFYGCGCKDKK